MINTIVTHDGKPVAATDGAIDWYRIWSHINGKDFAKHDENHFNEWQKNHTLDGMTVSEFCDVEKIKVWRWNIIQCDFIEQE